MRFLGSTLRLLTCTSTALLMAGPAVAADASAYPDRPIRWVVPDTEGGGTDVVARLIARVSPAYLNNQQFVIDNKPGGNTVIGSQIVATAKPDGYGPSKAGLIGWPLQVAGAWGPRGIRTNAVSPGLIRTQLSDHLYQRPEVLAGRFKTIPVRRIATPQDIASMVRFLVSEEASYVNGQEFTVDGGFMRTALMNIQPQAYATSPT